MLSSSAQVYHALFHSYIRYGIIVWGNASETTLGPLKAVINRAIRIMTFAPFGPLNLDPLYDQLQILDLNQVFLLETGKFMFKYKKGLLPVTIANFFDFYRPAVHIHDFRQRLNNDVPEMICRTVSAENSIQKRGELLWDGTPEEIKECDSIDQFKKLYKNLFFT